MTTTKTYRFASDTEGWTAAPGHANVHQFHHGPKKSNNGRTYNDITTHGGCIRSTAKNTPGTTSNAWNLTTTWAAMGVPAGHVVTGLKADYQYRFDLGKNFAGIVANANSTGPFQVLDGSDSVIGETSTAIVVANGSGFSAGKYSHKPSGPNVVGAQTAGVNRYWGQVAGSTLLVPSSMSRHDAAVKLKLSNTLQAVSNDIHDYIRVRHGWITLTVTHRRRRITTS